ncbi:histone-lysine N-methyltransferase 2D-like isoform X2 [Asterias rubens]|uniref:histone-lysine N-methyltransferase 2D-like isoform X2 n=1 Tax=Asterias rubens TaxID=7604 RepID=UPI0014554B79|nr:histone-lysine N-methyltransferase 2D-like isoform X2 [Asterias rubens]
MADKQSHKDTIVIWHEAVQLFDRGERRTALANLQTIQEPSAKILYNIGHIQQVSDNNRNAVQSFKRCVEKDPHMGIGHFQLAQTHYRQKNYKDAFNSLEKARSCLRGNKFIDYKQLGLAYKLYECEILHNLALTFAALSDTHGAMEMMREAVRYKSDARHNSIDSAQQALQKGQIPKPFLIPEHHIFRPPAAKVQNVQGVDYLGQAKVLSELVVPDSEAKKGRSPSPLPPKRPPPMAAPSNAFQPIDTQPIRSHSPNPKSPPSRPPPGPPPSGPPSGPPPGPPPSGPPSGPPPGPPPSAPPSVNRSSPSIPMHPPPTLPGGTSPSPSPTSPTYAKPTHKDTINIWHEGVLMFEKGQVGPALDQMLRIVEPSAKILFNIGVLHLKMGNVADADEVFQMVVVKDPHLAIGHFQHGNIQCQLNRPDQARRQYEKCMTSFRGHKFIDYKQLGLAYKLYEFEVLHNQAWAYNKLRQRETCLQLLKEAQGTRPETKHDGVDNALKNAQAGAPFDIMKLPKGALFRPPKAKIDNVKKIDYLGQATVISELAGNERRSPSPTVDASITDSFYLPMSPLTPLSPPSTTPLSPHPTTPLSPPAQVAKHLKPRPGKSLPAPPVNFQPEVPRKSLPAPPGNFQPESPRKSLPAPPVKFQPNSPRKSLPAPPANSQPEPPRKSLPGPPNKGGQRTPPFLTSIPKVELPAPVPPRSTSLGLTEPPQSPGPPDRPIPPIPIPVEDSTIPRRQPPPPPTQNGSENITINGNHKRKTSPPFNPNKPLPTLPNLDSPSNTPPPSQRRVSPVPPDKPVPPSPNRNSPALGRRTPSGPPDKPLPQSPNRLSPSVPLRTPPPIPNSGASDSQDKRKRSHSPLPPNIPVPPPPPKDKNDGRKRSVSPLPPNVPLPPPPVKSDGVKQNKIGCGDANGPSPAAARKFFSNAQAKRGGMTIANNNTHLDTDFWRESSENRRESSPSQQCRTSPALPTRDSPSPTIYEVS